MEKQNISFYGYNDGKAIEIYNCINLFLPTVISVILSLIFSLFSYFFRNPYLLVMWILPAILFLTYILCVSMTGYNDRVFLSGAKKKHSFIVENETLARDGKPMRRWLVARRLPTAPHSDSTFPRCSTRFSTSTTATCNLRPRMRFATRYADGVSSTNTPSTTSASTRD